MRAGLLSPASCEVLTMIRAAYGKSVPCPDCGLRILTSDDLVVICSRCRACIDRSQCWDCIVSCACADPSPVQACERCHHPLPDLVFTLEP